MTSLPPSHASNKLHALFAIAGLIERKAATINELRQDGSRPFESVSVCVCDEQGSLSEPDERPVVGKPRLVVSVQRWGQDETVNQLTDAGRLQTMANDADEGKLAGFLNKFSYTEALYPESLGDRHKEYSFAANTHEEARAIFEFQVRKHHGWTVGHSECCESYAEFEKSLEAKVLRYGENAELSGLCTWSGKLSDLVKERAGDDDETLPGIRRAITEARGPFVVCSYNDTFNNPNPVLRDFASLEEAKAHERSLLMERGWEVMRADQGGHDGPLERIKCDSVTIRIETGDWSKNGLRWSSDDLCHDITAAEIRKELEADGHEPEDIDDDFLEVAAAEARRLSRGLDPVWSQRRREELEAVADEIRNVFCKELEHQVVLEPVFARDGSVDVGLSCNVPVAMKVVSARLMETLGAVSLPASPRPGARNDQMRVRLPQHAMERLHILHQQAQECQQEEVLQAGIRI